MISAIIYKLDLHKAYNLDDITEIECASDLVSDLISELHNTRHFFFISSYSEVILCSSRF